MRIKWLHNYFEHPKGQWLVFGNSIARTLHMHKQVELVSSQTPPALSFTRKSLIWLALTMLSCLLSPDPFLVSEWGLGMMEINKAVDILNLMKFQWIISPHNTWTIAHNVYIQYVLCIHFTSHVPIYMSRQCRVQSIMLSWHSLHRSKLGHPLLISLQVWGRDRLGALCDGRGEVFHGGWQLQVLFGYFLDLVRTLALNHTTHCHHGCIPEQPKRSYHHRGGPTRSHARDVDLVREHLLLL